MTIDRRRLVIAGAATAAAIGGATVGWRRLAARREAEMVWRLQFERPAGGQLALAGFRGRPLLLNFWATWCPPCVGELPLLDRFYRDLSASGRWQVIGLAVDGREPVNGFLATRPVGFPVGLAGMAGVDLSRALGNQDGALPFTVVFESTGVVAGRKLGRIRAEDLQGWQRDVT